MEAPGDYCEKVPVNRLEGDTSSTHTHMRDQNRACREFIHKLHCFVLARFRLLSGSCLVLGLQQIQLAHTVRKTSMFSLTPQLLYIRDRLVFC